MKLEWGSSDMAGNFTSFAKEKRQKAAKATSGTSKGPRSRGGRRVPTDVSEARTFKAANSRPAQSTRTVAAKPAAAKAAPKKSAANMVQVAVPVITRQRPTRQVSDVKQTVAKPAPLAAAKKDIRVGGLFGRTGGQWYLGKRPGKG